MNENNNDMFIGIAVFISIILFFTSREVLPSFLIIAFIIYGFSFVASKKKAVSESYVRTKKEEDEINKKLIEKRRTIEEYNSTIAELINKKENIETFIADKDLDAVLDKETTVQFTDHVTSDEIKNQLALYKVEEKNAVKAIVTRKKYNQTNTNRQIKQLLRAFNAEADYYISNVTPKNVDSFRDKLAKSFDQLNKLFEIDGVALELDYLKLKLKQLSIIYQYQIQIEKEREL